MGENTILRLKGQKTFKGIELYVQSKVFEDFWKGASSGEVLAITEGYLAGESLYKMNNEIGIPEYVQYRSGENVMKNGGALAFTRCVGIDVGKNFTFNVAMSNEMLKEFLHKVKSLHAWILREYGGKVSWDIEITSSEKIWCSGGSVIL